MTEKGNWLNTEKRIWENAVKPCKMLGFCPYGQLVEEFPLHPEFEDENLNEVDINTGFNCEVFGHDCPVFYHAEPFSEDNEVTEEEYELFVKEIEDKYTKKEGD